ncbi:hypothetical protein [Jiella pelagia]|uniref:Uncharacterized protein n=1 Tax=Jiella pelagia TaxID=2986949 RepID=A0ABY7C593_9HYPH|nr:hypothetical protein [Jiella pelagia]WAP71007.1 hypothetical protein OH818_14220 [Jiella pelagia]
MTLPTNEGLSSISPRRSEETTREVAKFTATYVNGVAIGLALVGGLAPLFNAVYFTKELPIAWWQLVLISFICLMVSVAIHLAARRYLERELEK